MSHHNEHKDYASLGVFAGYGECEQRSATMDNLARLVIACQQYQEGLISSQDWKWKAIQLLGDASDEEVIALCHLITEFQIHLRAGH